MARFTRAIMRATSSLLRSRAGQVLLGNLVAMASADGFRHSEWRHGDYARLVFLSSTSRGRENNSASLYTSIDCFGRIREATGRLQYIETPLNFSRRVIAFRRMMPVGAR